MCVYECVVNLTFASILRLPPVIEKWHYKSLLTYLYPFTGTFVLWPGVSNTTLKGESHARLSAKLQVSNAQLIFKNWSLSLDTTFCEILVPNCALTIVVTLSTAVCV